MLENNCVFLTEHVLNMLKTLDDCDFFEGSLYICFNCRSLWYLKGCANWAKRKRTQVL